MIGGMGVSRLSFRAIQLCIAETLAAEKCQVLLTQAGMNRLPVVATTQPVLHFNQTRSLPVPGMCCPVSLLTFTPAVPEAEHRALDVLHTLNGRVRIELSLCQVAEELIRTPWRPQNTDTRGY